jgi:hypothetical protein
MAIDLQEQGAGMLRLGAIQAGANRLFAGLSGPNSVLSVLASAAMPVWGMPERKTETVH